ncbi:hypothetical protein EAF00_011643 [Botryotinia globosa]|nr:hypothetical protein EAF00_011643 [Botryotinia globosa]
MDIQYPSVLTPPSIHPSKEWSGSDIYSGQAGIDARGKVGIFVLFFFDSFPKQINATQRNATHATHATQRNGI